jgi:multidrug efflux pump
VKFYEICIRRPVFTIVLALGLIILGFLGLSELGVREYPVVESPVISILANYTGANAEVMESQVTEVLEEAVNTVAGIKTMTSSSRDGATRIRIEFELGTNLDAAANDVRDQLSRAVRLLPRDMDPPSLTKADADGGAVLTFVLRSKSHDLMALTEIADRVKDQLQTVPEVGAVDILGEKRYSIKIWLDPEKLAARGPPRLMSPPHCEERAWSCPAVGSRTPLPS